MGIFSFRDNFPKIGKEVWVHESATVVGAVELADEVSVWPGASLRGDIEPIRIGRESNIQDNAVLHTDHGAPCRVGERVTVGHGAILHGCTIGDETLIGMGATILNRSTIGRHCLVGAGTLITENKTFPDGVLIMGRPGRVARSLTEEEIRQIRDNAREYLQAKNDYRTKVVRLDEPGTDKR